MNATVIGSRSQTSEASEGHKRDSGAEDAIVRAEPWRGEPRRLQPSEHRGDEERQVGGDIPEVRHAEQQPPVGEPVIVRVLRDPVEQERADDRGERHGREDHEPHDLPTTS
jgi:hypothetical protein